MRRLDGITGLAYNLTPDPAGSKRRTEITKMANNPDIVLAKDIAALYTGYRNLHKEYKYNNNLDKVAEKFGQENTVTFSLRDRYDTVCKLMKNIYKEIKDNPTII